MRAGSWIISSFLRLHFRPSTGSIDNFVAGVDGLAHSATEDLSCDAASLVHPPSRWRLQLRSSSPFPGCVSPIESSRRSIFLPRWSLFPRFAGSIARRRFPILRPAPLSNAHASFQTRWGGGLSVLRKNHLVSRHELPVTVSALQAG